MDAVRLLRYEFLGYSGDVTLFGYQEQRLADFLTAEGVLIIHYHMTSALVDGSLRRTVIADILPNAPQIPPPLDQPGQTLNLFDLDRVTQMF